MKRKPLPPAVATALTAIVSTLQLAKDERITIHDGTAYIEQTTSTRAELEPLLSRREVARLLRCTPWCVDKLRQRGVLHSVKCGSSRSRGFARAEVAKLIGGAR